MPVLCLTNSCQAVIISLSELNGDDMSCINSPYSGHLSKRETSYWPRAFPSQRELTVVFDLNSSDALSKACHSK